MKNKQTVLLGLGIGIGAAIVLLLVFFSGVYIGSKRAGLFPFWERRHIYQNGFVPNRFGHGTVGTIDTVGENTFVVKDRSGALKTILVDEKTILRRDRAEIKFSDLKKDEQVIVIGEPQEQEGAIKAKAVRVITEFIKDATRSATPNMFPKFRKDFPSLP
ncbi:MAG: hypothetical protein A3D75_02370 [Candidatus Levybacteria bacterium RIFCSPHIGHO2_02_FULL_37_18]|uniref:DUF5666 domain-containing protein n=2 Tax=Patescibacteria group TaxID=1783273 RepID=A0A1G1Y1I2_9BACT|nr:MAG: hypothetical protein A3D75_02370 [Candidatus Levybacteria bacterium RIFCSPHIGHO2_02_FULL_37_18]OGK61677.1 MAG: hypothetical protein A3I56_00025 [Candidatus Roizmanbacteria bacterium RIFCSPLOWO2_02_FULL_43_10]OGY46081.1 MAG: hypothetical protein A2731_04130 [Candidatus Buchananbacteria bacterium RIFCSPHIGHO2_01_FULL_39_8]